MTAKNRWIECIKSKLASEGVGLYDTEKAVKVLSACVLGGKLIELYMESISTMDGEKHGNIQQVR